MNKKTLGILGGMGPSATVDLFKMIVDNTEASSDQEHIHILIDCNTNIPDRTEAILHGAESPVKELTRSARTLEDAGADFLIIPCNTAHYFIDSVRSSVNIPVLNMIEITGREIQKRGLSDAIILCTEGTRATNIYKDTLLLLGVNAIYPDDELQKEVTHIIYEGVKKGEPSLDPSHFNLLLRKLEEEYHAISVLGCTELPLAVPAYGLEGNFINPTYLLAREAIVYAGYSPKE